MGGSEGEGSRDGIMGRLLGKGAYCVPRGFNPVRNPVGVITVILA